MEVTVFFSYCDVYLKWITEKEKNIGGEFYALVVDWMEAGLNLQLIVRNRQVYVDKMIEEVCCFSEGWV